MNRSDSQILSATPVLVAVFVAGSLSAATNAQPQSCTGGSVVYDSTTTPRRPVGCLFPNWGAMEQTICRGLATLGPSNSGTCHLCVQPEYEAMVLNGSFLLPADPGNPSSAPRLTTDQFPASRIEGVSTPFRCLGCTNPPFDIAAWWKLDDYTAAAQVKDTAGNMPAGSRYGTAAVPGKVGNAAWFNGVSDRIEVPHASATDVGAASSGPPMVGNFSIDAWVKITRNDRSTSGVRVLVEKRSANYPNKWPFTGYSFFLYNGYLGLQLAGAGAPYANYVSTLRVPQDGEWHLVAVSVDRVIASTVQFYLDGTTTTVSGNIPKGSLKNPSFLRIGMVTIDNHGGAFNGSIDEVEFFNRFLSKTEIDSIYKANCYGKCNALCPGLLGISTDGSIYTINTTTGAITNPRGPNKGGWTTYQTPSSIAYSPTGVLYGLGQSEYTIPPVAPALYTINLLTGEPTVVGPTGFGSQTEGDIAFDPITGILYGVDGATGELFTIDTATGTGKILGTIPHTCDPYNMDLSAIAFDSAGNLFVVDTMFQCLLKVDKSNAKVLSTVKLDPIPGSVAGLAFDSAGIAYFVCGDGGLNTLLTVNVATGAIKAVGSLGGVATGGLSGLTFTMSACPAPRLSSAIGAGH